jgi:hypothetical protein
MSNIRILVDFINDTEQQNFKIQVGRETTVAHLQYKLRAYIKLKDCEACYLFFQYQALIYGNNEKLYVGNKLLTDIQSELCMETLHVKMMIESTFGSPSKMFVSATIKELSTGLCWILSLNYNYFNLYNYTDTYVFDTMENCIRKLCLERTNDKLTISDKNNNSVNITPT